jgi:hypothetical protein
MALKDFPPVSSQASPSHQTLLAEAEIADIDVEVLRDILWLTVAHDHLIAFPVAAQRILDILQIAPETWQPALTEAGIPRWETALKWVIKNKKYLTERIGEHFGRQASTTGTNPINGYGIPQFPMYAVLCEPTPYAESNKLHFIRLSGHLLIAHVLAMQDNTTRIEFELTPDKLDWKPLPNSVVSSALAVRRTADSYDCHFLKELPTSLPPEEFAEELEKLPPSQSWQQGEDRIPLYRFLQKAWGILDWLEKTGGGGGGSGGHASVGGRLEVGGRLSIEKLPIGDRDDQSSDWGTTDIVKITTVSPRKKKLRLDSDLCPDEDVDDDEILLSGFDCAITKKDPGSLARAARAKARHIASENQLFPWAYDVLADEEVVNLLLQIDREMTVMETNGASATLGNNRVKYEMFCLVHVMLWTGSDVVRAASINVCRARSKSGETPFGIILSDAKNVRWQIPALTPEYQTKLDDDIQGLREAKASIELPDPFDLAHLFRPLVKIPTEDAAPLFQTDIKTLEKALRQWLKSYSPDGRITLAKIASMLWHNLYSEQGDPTIASCITGELHHLARVRLFYTTPDISMLQGIYLSVTSRIARYFSTQLGREPNSTAGLIAPEDSRPSGAVGARLCPTPAAVSAYICSLKEALTNASRYSDRTEFCRYHNLYTLYTLQFFAYATTCRAIVTPYLRLEQIHPTRRIAPLSDKDDEFAHKTRLIWIPDALWQQMHSYAKHLDALRPQLNCAKNSVYWEPCFFLDPQFKPVAARPKEIEKHLHELIRIKPNTHRRFLRTELIERRCPPEVIDAFLGHWQQGEEPYGPFSSFSARSYVETLRTYLEPLLAEIGLTHAIASRIAP